MSRLLAIGDIHGRACALDTLLERLAPAPADRLVFLGDYVNGGAESARVLDRLAGLLERPNTVALRGNHDEVLRESLLDDARFETWLEYVGPETPESYRRLGVEPTRTAIIERHGAVLSSLRDWHEEPEAIFVHARLDPDLPMNEQHPGDLVWLKLEGPCPLHRSGKITVSGHTRQRDGVPRDFGGAICIDTNAKGDGWLTCLDVTTRRCVQARPDGTVRETAVLPV